MLVSLLVNFDLHLKSPLHMCTNFPTKQKNCDRGIIFILEEQALHELKNIKTSRDKKKYLYSNNFKKYVKSYHYVFVNDNKVELCITDNCDTDDIHLILNDILQEFVIGKNNKEIFIFLPITNSKFDNLVEKMITYDLKDPKIESKFQETCLCLKHTSTPIHSSKFTRREIDYLLHHKNEEICGIQIKFNKDAIKFLRKASHIGHSHNKDNTISQKEISGELKVIDFSPEHIVTIGLDKNSIQLGKEENVNVSPSRYNFHSHPKEAYVRHSVEKAWPSVIDFLGILKLGNRTILHAVATLEGLYVISFTSHWLDKIDKIKSSFVDKNYDIDHSLNYTPLEYVNMVNQIKYRNHPIFYVQYKSWDEDMIFSVYYGKDGLNCFFKDS